MKKLLLFIPVLILSFVGPDSFIDSWKNDPILKPATFSFAVFDVDSQEYILQHNKEKVLPAASTQKLISTSIALRTLGSDHQFSTQITHTGRIQDGTLKGNICIFPNYNPALANKRFRKSTDDIIVILDEFLKKNNIKIIGGGIEVVDSTYETETLPRTWVWEDIGNYYGANPTGTILNENVIELFFKSGAIGEPTEIVKTKPEMPWIKFNNRVIASKKNRDLAYVFSEPNGRFLTVEGTIPANRNSFKVKASLPNPQKALAYQIQSQLKAKGYTVRGKYKVRQKAKKQTYSIGSVKSPTVQEIVNVTNQKSINVLAENLLMNSHLFSNPKQDQLKWTKNYLKNKMKINTEGMVLKDGSGLSRFNAISAQQLVEVLNKMKKSEVLYNSLPIAGESGTLKNFLLNSFAKGKLRAKSGSMQGIRSYAGYVTTSKGKNLAFAIIVNNANASNSKTKKKIEEFLDYVSQL